MMRHEDHKSEHYQTNSEKETEQLAERLSSYFAPGDVIALYGNLGAGKTSFVRGLVKGLGSMDLVNSPTFTIINHYAGPVPIYHFDVFRLNDELEIEDLDIDHYLYGDGICVIEWAEKAEALLPSQYWSITINIDFQDKRSIIIKQIANEKVAL